MYDQKTERRLAMKCGLSVKVIMAENQKPKTIYSGTVHQWKDFDRLLGVLDEQFEQESEIIRENQ